MFIFHRTSCWKCVIFISRLSSNRGIKKGVKPLMLEAFKGSTLDFFWAVVCVHFGGFQHMFLPLAVLWCMKVLQFWLRNNNCILIHGKWIGYLLRLLDIYVCMCVSYCNIIKMKILLVFLVFVSVIKSQCYCVCVFHCILSMLIKNLFATTNYTKLKPTHSTLVVFL